MSYKAFYAAYNATKRQGNPLSKDEVIEQYTDGRTNSLRALTAEELSGLVRSLNQLLPDGKTMEQDKTQRMRRAILSIWHKMRRSVPDCIAWAEKQGVKGNKKRFNDYTTQELFVLIQISEKMLSEYNNAMRQAVKEA